MPNDDHFQGMTDPSLYLQTHDNLLMDTEGDRDMDEQLLDVSDPYGVQHPPY
jgi:hypothetical protein